MALQNSRGCLVDWIYSKAVEVFVDGKRLNHSKDLHNGPVWLSVYAEIPCLFVSIYAVLCSSDN